MLPRPASSPATRAPPLFLTETNLRSVTILMPPRFHTGPKVEQCQNCPKLRAKIKELENQLKIREKKIKQDSSTLKEFRAKTETLEAKLQQLEREKKAEVSKQQKVVNPGLFRLCKDTVTYLDKKKTDGNTFAIAMLDSFTKK